jgi:hypothetical protein
LAIGDIIALMTALISGTSHEKMTHCMEKRLTPVTTLNPHQLATNGFEISAREIQENSGP